MPEGTTPTFVDKLGNAFKSPFSNEATDQESFNSWFWAIVGFVGGSTLAYNRAQSGKDPMLVNGFIKV